MRSRALRYGPLALVALACLIPVQKPGCGQTSHDVLTRSLAHITNHIGQIILIARMTVTGPWQSLSIPRGQSQAFNANMTGAKPHT